MRRRLAVPVKWKLDRVISGGQVGADIAGVRAAKRAGIPTGGFMPLGFITIRGLRPEYAEEFGMRECLDTTYPTRTVKNAKESDGTLRFAYRWNSPGELCTLRAIERFSKPFLDIAPSTPPTPRQVACWLRDERIRVLNVAGNADVELEEFVETFLAEVFRWLHE